MTNSTTTSTSTTYYINSSAVEGIIKNFPDDSEESLLDESVGAYINVLLHYYIYIYYTMIIISAVLSFLSYIFYFILCYHSIITIILLSY